MTVAALVTAGCKSETKLTHPIAPTATPVADEVSPSENQLTDAEIERAVEREMLSAGVIAPKMEIRVTLGIVELIGEVPHLLAKKRAVKVAGAIKGVRSVIDRVHVAPVSRPDAEIAADVKKTLAADPAAEAYQVDVSVSGGVVTLAGRVDSWQERQLAESLAMQVKGIERVVNDIELDTGAVRSDAEILADVESRLRWDVLVDHGLIGATVVDGHVRLAGLVGSVAEKFRAAADAWVAGARTVDIDDLDVDWIAADAYRRSAESVVVSDAEIRAALMDALLIDPRVKSYRVAVGVTAGKVTLSGAVPNLRARRAAGQIAEQTTGVRSVANDIEVKSESEIADRDLARSVTVALALNPVTEAREIAVTVEDGTATLNGEVDSFAEKTEAAAVATRVDGVNAVVNRIDVKLAGPPVGAELPDSELEARVIRELLFDPNVDLYQVSVEVNRGTVTLTGEVDSTFESLQAELNAIQAGATRVISKLVVR